MKYTCLRAPDSNHPGIPLINITTLEDRELCVAVTSCGLCIIGQTHDSLDGLNHVIQSRGHDNSPPDDHVKLSQQVSLASQGDDDHVRVYETIYSLLDDISPKYRSAFCSELSYKLLELQKLQGEET